MTSRSEQLFAEAKRLIPGGVNSPVRAFKGVGGSPRFIARGAGAHIVDVDGHDYIDYVGSWGPLILGHAHPAVVVAVQRAVELGASFGAPTEAENRLAALIVEAVPSIEMVRLVSSGTEACMSALRVARAHTGRDKIIKFDGCYHGHADGLLVKAGSGGATFGVADSAGVPAAYARETLVARYNDPESVRALLEANPDNVAAVIVEPIAGNMGVVPPAEGFLVALRDLTKAAGALLIFDEVISGFRASPGGAQALYGVTPDLTCLGKVVGGGLPIGAYGGPAEIMERVSPLGPAYQAGTLSGNPVAVAAGLATLTELASGDAYDRIERAAAALEEGYRGIIAEAGRPLSLNRAGSVMTLFFEGGPIVDYESAARSDRGAFADYFHAMLDQGVSLPPSQFEAMFVSAAHSEADVDRTLEAARGALTGRS